MIGGGKGRGDWSFSFFFVRSFGKREKREVGGVESCKCWVFFCVSVGRVFY